MQVPFPPSLCHTRHTSSHSSESRLPLREFLTDAIDENLTAAAGERAETRVLQPLQHGFERQLVQLVEVPDFRRAERVQVHAGEPRLQVAEQLFVPFELQRRVHPALHENLVAAERDGFFDLLVEFFARENVGVGIGRLAVERAEVAHRAHTLV